MPIPIAIVLAFVTGVGASLAARGELRLRPRSALLTRSFFAYLAFMLLLFVPSLVYLYLFYGDWFLMYFMDVTQIPSAVVLLGLLGFVSLGIFGFGAGAHLARARRDLWLFIMLFGLPLVVGLLLIPLWDRVMWVGSFLQFRAQVGGKPYLESSIRYSSLLVCGVVSVGFSNLLIQLVRSARRT